MFRVSAIFEIGEGWDEKDEVLYRAAGGKSSYSDCAPDDKQPKKRIRTHVWVVKALDEAKLLRQRLIASGAGAIVTFREV